MLAGSPGNNLGDALDTFSDDTRSTTAYVSSDLLIPAALPFTTWTSPNAFPLASGMIVPVQDTSISVVEDKLLLQDSPSASPESACACRLHPAISRSSHLRAHQASSVSDGQVFLVNSFPPVTDTTGLLLWSVSTLSGCPRDALTGGRKICSFSRGEGGSGYQ